MLRSKWRAAVKMSGDPRNVGERLIGKAMVQTPERTAVVQPTGDGGSEGASQKSLVEAIHDTLLEEMRANDRIVVLGEDVGRRGGVFRVTAGFLEEFGEERVVDTPLAESGIIGTAIGMALNGLRPVAEIQFLDFIAPAMDQIMNEAARLRSEERRVGKECRSRWSP